MDSEDAREQVAKQLEEELKKDKTNGDGPCFTHLGFLK